MFIGAGEGGARCLLFVYGTLRRGYHWHDKFLSASSGVVALGGATTVSRHPLVVGECGVPYVLDNLDGVGNAVRGECYMVPEAAMPGMDEYEGCGKGYYRRRAVNGVLDSHRSGDGGSSSSVRNLCRRAALVLMC